MHAVIALVVLFDFFADSSLAVMMMMMMVTM